MAADVRESQETSLNQFEEAAEEWNNVTEITPEFQNKENINVTNEGSGVKISSLVTVDVITEHLRTKPDLDTYLQQIKSRTNRRSSGNVFNNINVQNILCCLRRPPSLPPHQRQTVRLIQASALIAFSNEVIIVNLSWSSLLQSQSQIETGPEKLF